MLLRCTTADGVLHTTDHQIPQNLPILINALQALQHVAASEQHRLNLVVAEFRRGLRGDGK